MKTTLLTLLSLCSFVFGISQTHTYQFNGVLTEAAAAGPTLTQVLDATCTPAGANGSFNTEIITTSVGNSGTAKPVFLFNQNAGLSYANGSGLGITGTYTIHIFVRKTDYFLGNFSFQKPQLSG